MENAVKWTWFGASLKNGMEIVFQSQMDPDLSKFDYNGKPILFRRLVFIKRINGPKGEVAIAMVKSVVSSEPNKVGTMQKDLIAFLLEPDQQIINDARKICGETVIDPASTVDMNAEVRDKENIKKLAIVD